MNPREMTRCSRIAAFVVIGLLSPTPAVRAEDLVLSVLGFSRTDASGSIDLAPGEERPATVGLSLDEAAVDGAPVSLDTALLEGRVAGVGPSSLPPFRLARPATGRVRRGTDGARVLELSAEIVVETPDKSRSTTYDVMAVGEIPETATSSAAVDLLVEAVRRPDADQGQSRSTTGTPAFSGVLRGQIDVAP